MPHELKTAVLRGTLPGDPATNGFSIHALTLALQDEFDRYEIRETSTARQVAGHLDQLTGEPEQWVAIGWVNARLNTMVFEERTDAGGQVSRVLEERRAIRKKAS